MKKLLILVSLLVSGITFTIQGGNGTSQPALINTNKTKSYHPIQKFLSFFACATLEKETPKTRRLPSISQKDISETPVEEQPEIVIAPEDLVSEDIDRDLLGSSVFEARVEKETIKKPVETKTALAPEDVDSFLFSSCDRDKHAPSSAKVIDEIFGGNPVSTDNSLLASSGFSRKHTSSVLIENSFAEATTK